MYTIIIIIFFLLIRKSAKPENFLTEEPSCLINSLTINFLSIFTLHNILTLSRFSFKKYPNKYFLNQNQIFSRVKDS